MRTRGRRVEGKSLNRIVDASRTVEQSPMQNTTQRRRQRLGARFPWTQYSFYVYQDAGFAVVADGFVHIEAQEVKYVAAVTKDDALMITGGVYVWICVIMVWNTRACSIGLQTAATFEDVPHSDATDMRWPLRCYFFNPETEVFESFHIHHIGDIHLATAI